MRIFKRAPLEGKVAEAIMVLEAKIHDLEARLEAAERGGKDAWDRASALCDRHKQACEDLKADWRDFLKELIFAMARGQ